MHNNSEIEKIIYALSRHEMALARLYQVFSKSKGNPQFWLDISKQEYVHHQWLLALHNNSVSKKLFYDRDIFKIEAVESSIEYIEELIKKASEISDLVALNHALDLEKAMIEAEYFSIFLTDDYSVKHILDDLKNETSEHIAKIEAEIIKKKRDS